jgi:dTDP-4-amino-4,6-dideoxygalactose transaminase
MSSDTIDLAIFGRAPRFSEPLHVGRPNIGDRERLLERIGDILDRRWFTNDGPVVQELEGRICELTGVEHCVAMCNGTVALEIAIRALGLRGEVILPSYTFIATAHALKWQEINPVFCDIDSRTHNLDPGRVESLIGEQTTGIIGVHLWGRACDVEGLSRIAERHDLALIFDAAHACGCSHGGRMIGGFGRAEVFSFHATKFINSFEGGAVVTHDAALAERMRFMRNFGFAGYDNVVSVGTNGKMTEVCAAMGLTSIEALDEIVAANRANYEGYVRGLGPVAGLSLLAFDEVERNNYQYVVVQVDESEAGLSRDEVVELLFSEGVLARRYFHPGCHRMEAFRKLTPEPPQLPATERVAARVLLLPNGTSVGGDEIATICALLDRAVSHAPAVRRRLEERRGRAESGEQGA